MILPTHKNMQTGAEVMLCTRGETAVTFIPAGTCSGDHVEGFRFVAPVAEFDSLYRPIMQGGGVRE